MRASITNTGSVSAVSDRAVAEQVAAELNASNDGLTYSVAPYQGGRFVVRARDEDGNDLGSI